MKISKYLIITGCALALISCASNPDKAKTEKSAPSASSTQTEDTKTVSPAQKFINSMDEVQLKFISSPADTEIGKDFPSAFTVSAMDINGAPLSDYSLTFSYPDSKKDNSIVYATQAVTTGSDGKASLKLPVPKIAANDSVTVYPTPISKNDKVVQAAKNKAVTATYRVKSDLVKSGIILYVWEYDAKGKLANNFYNILGELQNNGAKKVGNAPLSDDSYLTSTPEKQSQVNRSIVGDEFRYLIGGTLKYVTPTAKVENGYSCTMTADIYAIDMATGTEIYRKTFEGSGFGEKWGKDITDCKNKLSKKIVNDILYSF